MKQFSAIALAMVLIFSGCNSKDKKVAAEKNDYEKTKETLEEKEKKNPLAFLSITSKDKRNLIGQTVIKGKVNNLAKVCVYKDVQLELLYYSKTGVLLQKTDEVIYDLVEPGKSAEFKTKEFAPKGTDSVAIKILSAKVN